MAKQSAKSKVNWKNIGHEDQLKVLASNSINQILKDYYLPGTTDDAFTRILRRDLSLWDVESEKSPEFNTRGGPPKKEVFLGAWRDLDRSEALLELIDNSIDEWRSRRERHPQYCAKKLDVFIDINTDLGLLTYEDNAGGVKEELLDNLVIPGYSKTTALTHTIGSYKTGGKKAVFRLATEARITTRYWNPAGTSDMAYSVHLDRTWIDDDIQYQYNYSPLKNTSSIEPGQTRYVFRLREEPIGDPWYTKVKPLADIERAIQQAYTLLLIRNPNIHIHLQQRREAIKPDLNLFDFSGAHTKELDIRPQQVIFKTELEWQNKKYPVDLEIVLGCRPTTGVKEGNWGIDLYGNDRLFVAYDQNTFDKPAGAHRTLLRGFVNIRGPNLFIPWDTHKRHLNKDSDVIHILTTNPAIRELFSRWQSTYRQISRLPKNKIKNTISTKLPKIRSKSDIAIPHCDTVELDIKEKRGVKLPNTVYAPHVHPPTQSANNHIKIAFQLTEDEARTIAAHYGLTGTPTKQLSETIRDDVMKRAGSRSKPGRAKTKPGRTKKSS